MATLQQLQQIINNPNARKMLDLISSSEGTSQNGYNTAFGGGYIHDLSAHPNTRSTFTQTDGKTNTTTAAGRYQFLNSTWQGLQKQYGFKGFSPQEQDLGALALLSQNGALPYVLKGDFNTAIQKSGGTWASLPSSQYAQHKKSWDFVNKQLGQNNSEPNFVDLNKLGYKASTQATEPNFVDLKALGYQATPQQPSPQNEPQFTDLRSLGYKG